MNESTGIRGHAARDWGRGKKASHGAFKPSHSHTHGYTPGFGGTETVLSVLTEWPCSLRTKPWQTHQVREERKHKTYSCWRALFIVRSWVFSLERMRQKKMPLEENKHKANSINFAVSPKLLLWTSYIEDIILLVALRGSKSLCVVWTISIKQTLEKFSPIFYCVWIQSYIFGVKHSLNFYYTFYTKDIKIIKGIKIIGAY